MGGGGSTLTLLLGSRFTLYPSQERRPLAAWQLPRDYDARSGLQDNRPRHFACSSKSYQRKFQALRNLDHEAQCGFRNRRGCTDPDGTFTVKSLVTKRREHNQETWILFLDLVKAFDTVPRELLWRVLTKVGVPDKMVSILKAMHKNVEVLFEVDDV